MYDLTINIETEQSGFSYITPGIHENLRLAKADNSAPIVYELLPNGNEFIAFHFMNSEGLTFIHTEWLPKSDKEDVLIKKQSNLTKRLLHIGKKLVDSSLFKTIKTTSFKELATSYINIIGNAWQNKLFRGKIIYNNKNYTTFPNYVPFIESMDVPAEKSNLKIGGDDKVVKSQADVIQSRPNPFTVEQTSEGLSVTQPTDNLPF